MSATAATRSQRHHKQRCPGKYKAQGIEETYDPGQGSWLRRPLLPGHCLMIPSCQPKRYFINVSAPTAITVSASAVAGSRIRLIFFDATKAPRHRAQQRLYCGVIRFIVAKPGKTLFGADVECPTQQD